MKEYDEYAAWTESVARYPVTAESFYLALGFADELGEVADAQGGHAILKESGDALWYGARYATRVLGVPFSDVIKDALRVSCPDDVQLIVEAGVICGVEKKRVRDGAGWSNQVLVDKHAKAYRALTRAIAYIIFNLEDHNFTLLNALHANQGKLDDRAARGVLHGDGDNR